MDQVQKYDYKTLFKTLTIKHEFFTHIVPVPAAIYFSIITLSINDKFIYLILIISGISSATLFFLIGTFFRFQKLKTIFNRIIPAEVYYIKKDLFYLPYYEVILVTLRWILGISLAHILFGILLYNYFGIFNSRFHITAIPLALFIIPIEITGHYLITESEIRKYIKNSILKTIAIQENKKNKITIFLKVLFFIFSLTNMPIILLLSINYFSRNHGGIDHIFLHMIIIVLVLIFPLVSISYYLAKNIKENLDEIQSSLKEVSLGNFLQKIGILTYDEFGELALYLNKVVERLKHMYENLEYLNKHLEKKVEEKTYALKQSLEEVQFLKTRQDADYYLTTLLLKPFVNERIYDDDINSSLDYDFFIKQIKEFEFRNRKEEIGGDYCCFEKVILNDKSYLFFINADAMGKSIQGAGGVLVLGSMIQSMIQRNRFFKEEQSLSPEHWLRELFIQIHKTLETFKGTMYISAVIGLIDIQNLCLYYMNAEHPNPILIRNKEASFLNPQKNLSKLGLSIEKKQLFIHTLQLFKDDVIILGSDGKDDIEFNDGTMNDSEYFFIDILNQTDTSLYSIYNLINSKGNIKDDFSLLRIKVLKQSPLEDVEMQTEILKIKNECLKLINDGPLTKENLNFVYEKLKYYIKYNPLDTKILSIYSQICFKLNQFKEAIEVIERLLFREPFNLNYLIIANKFYKKLENSKYKFYLSDFEENKNKYDDLIKKINLQH